MGKGRYAFPGTRSSDRVMSEATIVIDLHELRDSIYSSSLADMFLNQITQQEGSETQ